MCIIYTISYLCGHLFHLDSPPITPCSKAEIKPISSVQRQKTPTTKPTKPITNNKPSTIQEQCPNADQASGSTPPLTAPQPSTIRYCPIPLLPTIFNCDQVCRQCSAGLLAYARRVYYFEVGCMMLKMPTRVTQERKLFNYNNNSNNNNKEDAKDGNGDRDSVDRSLEYYEKNIIDRILPPAILLKCWVAWRQDREHFRLLAVCGGADGELGQGFRGFFNDGVVVEDVKKPVGKGNFAATSSPIPIPSPSPSPFPQDYFFDDFLGGIIIRSLNLRSRAEIEAEEALQRKLKLLDAVIEARCLEAYALQKQQQQNWEEELAGWGEEGLGGMESEQGGSYAEGRLGREEEEELNPEGDLYFDLDLDSSGGLDQKEEEEEVVGLGFGLGLGELMPLLKRAVELRRFCEVNTAVGGSCGGVGKKGEE